MSDDLCSCGHSVDSHTILGCNTSVPNPARDPEERPKSLQPVNMNCPCIQNPRAAA